MTPRILSTAWFVVFASLTAPSYAAKPEFKAGLVTESRSSYREELRTSQESTLPAIAYPVRVQIERVTVALEGERISGEWYLNAGRFWVPAKDFSVRTGCSGRHERQSAPAETPRRQRGDGEDQGSREVRRGRARLNAAARLALIDGFASR